jgi:hypothetical protein
VTAEIAIINRTAIALAADSAVTVGGKRVHKHSNKLFMLSRVAPVGVMIYGTADFMGYPWETIIKEFRRQLGTRTLPTVAEYAAEFLAFLKGSAIDTSSEENIHVGMLALSVLDGIRDELDYDSKMEFRAQLREGLHLAVSEDRDEILPATDFPLDEFSAAYGDTIIEIAKETFEREVLTKSLSTAIIRTVWHLFRHDYFRCLSQD